MPRNGDRTSPVVPLAVTLGLVLLVGALWAVVFVNHGRGAGDATGAATSESSESSGGSKEGSSSSSSPSDSPTNGGSMGEARKALAADGSRVLVLGDSTGDGYDEWVHTWAQSEEMPVAGWLTESEDGYDSATEETRVWSGSMPSASAAYPVEHWEQMWPEQTPDLVILSYGHDYESPETATEDLEALRAKVSEEAPETPVVVTLQNPQREDANAETREAIAEWAKEENLPTIDVAKAFEESGAVAGDLRLDDYHPSAAGTELWVETVQEALGS